MARARPTPAVVEEATMHVSTVVSRFESIGLRAEIIMDRHRQIHTVMVSVPQRDELLRRSRILFEFRVDAGNVHQSDYDNALRAYLRDRSRYSWTEDPKWSQRYHGREDLRKIRES